MTQFLPPNLLALFAARDPIPFKPPTAQLSWEKDRTRNPYTGVANLTTLFEDPKDTPPPTRGETKQEKKVRRIKEKAIIRAKEIEEEVQNYDPHNNKDVTGDAFKTLFVGRINFDTSESKLRREFDMYGPIRKITMVKDSNGKPRGYAFIEFEHERDMHSLPCCCSLDMHAYPTAGGDNPKLRFVKMIRFVYSAPYYYDWIAAYKSADGKKIDGRRVLVDVERGRTVKGWKPRRLGGGLGSTRRGANDENVRHSGRDGPGREDERRESRRSPSRERSRRSSRERDRRDGRRDRDRDRDRDRKRDRDRDRDRDRKDKDRERDRDESSKDKGRDRDRDRKHRNRDRSRERDREGGRRKRSRERDRKDRDRSDRDKDRRSRTDKDRTKDEAKKERSDNTSDGMKQEPTNGNMDQEQPYRNHDGDRNDLKQEPGYPEPEEAYEKGQGDFQNSEPVKGYPDNAQQYDGMEY